MGLNKSERGGGGGMGGATQSVSGNYKSFEETNLTNASVCHVYPVTRTTGEERAECSKGGGGEFNSFRPHKCISVRSLLYAWC